MELQVNLEKTVKITFLQGKKGTNKVHPNLFRAFQRTKNVRFMFRRSRSSMKSKYYLCSCYEQRKNVCSVYLECKLHPDRSC